MIASRRGSSRSLLNLLIIGVLAGALVFLWTFLNDQGGQPAEQNPTLTPDTAAVAASSPTPPSASASQPETQPTPTPLIEPDVAISSSAQIVIPSAAVNAQIVQSYLDGTSWDVSTLGMNVGHLQGTNWLTDGPGNIVLSGHVEMSDGRKGVFADLGDLEPGALVILREEGEERRYVVREISTVEPTDLSPVRPTTSERLTLITCGNYDFFRDAYLERTVVVADPVS